MIKTLKLQLLSTLFLGTLTLAGCKDECKDVTCVQGACVDGNCVCDLGYEGADCSVPFNAKLSGTYTLTELCDLNMNRSYAVGIAPKAGTVNQITLSELWESPQDVVTGVFSSDFSSFSIARQSLGNSGYFIEASGATASVDGKTINLTYKIYNSDTLYSKIVLQHSRAEAFSL